MTSVPGVLRLDGSVIEEFDINENKIDELDQQSSAIDVTGSMQNKVTIATNIVNKINKCQVFIVQGVSENAKYVLSSSSSSITDNQNFVLHGGTRVLKKETNKNIDL